MKRAVMILIAIALVSTFVACSKKSEAAPAKEEFFVLGVQQPLTNDNAIAGQSALEAVKLFVEQRNKTGGFLGRQIKIASYDDQSSAEEAVKVANRIVEIDKANAVIGSLMSSNLFASGRIFEDAKIVTFGIGFSPSWMSQGWKHFFRANMNTDYSIPSLVETVNSLGLKSAAILRGEDDSSITGSDAFVKAAEKQGIKVNVITSHAASDTDFSGQIAAMLGTKPDAIYLSTFNYVVGTFMRQLRGFGYKGLVFSKEVFTNDQIQVAQQYANDFIFVAPYVTYPSIEECKEEEMTAFLKDFQQMFGKMPQHDCALRAWDAMLSLEAAIKIANSLKTEDIRQAVFKVKGVQALGGILDFTDGSGEGLLKVKTYIVQDMKYGTVQTWLDGGGYEKLKAQLK